MAGDSARVPNPFPSLAAATLDAQLREPVALTLLTKQVRDVSKVVDDYLANRSVRNEVSGAAMALWGPAGSGKTHAMGYAMAGARAVCKSRDRVCEQSYVLCETPNLSALRYKILQGISLDAMRVAVQRYVQVIGREQLQSQELETEVGREQQRTLLLRESLSEIGDLIANALIDPDKIAKQKSEELRKTGSEDFKNAVSYLDDPKLGPKAREWLCGGPVDGDDLKRLGINLTERGPDHPLLSLLVMLRVFQRAGVPLLVFLDQCENFLMSVMNGPLSQESIAFLQWLAEKVPQERGVLCVAMSSQVWKGLPTYLKTRFGFNVIPFSVLRLEEARQYIHAYVRRASLEDGETPIIYPFDEEALKVILENVRGNLRGFLQTCYLTFELSGSDGLVTAQVVQKALQSASRERPPLETVEREIENLLRERGLALIEIQRDVDRAAFLIQAPDGRRIAKAQITEALFQDSEAEQALKSLDAIDMGSPLPNIIVVLGYATPEVVELLKKASRFVMIHDQETFSAGFLEVLSNLDRTSASQIPPTTIDLEKAFSGLRSELLHLLDKRTLIGQSASSAIAYTMDKQERNRVFEQWREPRLNWAKERRLIEEQVKAARAERKAEELSALGWERDRAAKERSQKGLIIGFTMSACAVIAFLIYATHAFRYRFFDPLELLIKYGPLLMLPLLIAAAAYFLQSKGLVFGLPGAWNALYGEVRSLEELDQLATRFNRRHRRARKRYLFNPNPQVRYAAASNFDQVGHQSSLVRVLEAEILGAASFEDLEHAWRTEGNATVRRALASSISRLGATPIVRAADSRERMYAFEDDPDSLFRMALSIDVYPIVRDLWRPSTLKDVYQQGLNPENWHLHYQYPFALLQKVLRELSPIERPGLGTLDYLRVIPDLDAYYYFFRQWIFYLEQDLPALSAPDDLPLSPVTEPYEPRGARQDKPID